MIRYHGLPFSGPMETMLSLQGRHACVSYAHPGPLLEALELCQSVMLDNGAFSAWKSETPFDPEGFMDWATDTMRHPGVAWACLPDVIDGSESDNDALLSMGDMSGRWVPVWHLHESLERLERLAAYPLVALGSSGQYSQIGTPAWWQRMAQAMDVVCDDDGYPKTRLHGLRMMDPRVSSVFPFASADSTSCGRNIGIDSAWRGSYVPKSRRMRAAILIERYEAHATASRWCGASGGAWANDELFG